MRPRGYRSARRLSPTDATTMAHDESPPIRTDDDLYAPFAQAEKPRDRWRVGTEQEKGGVHTDGSVVRFHGARGVAVVLDALATKYGWQPEREHAGGEVIALRRRDASVTLEPGGQLELSGAPLRTIHETRAELDGHIAELRPISDELGIAWLGLGFHPFARRDELEWLPKLRYGVMREYLPTRGSMGLDMMLRTCTVQANFDYSSEHDAMRKPLQVSGFDQGLEVRILHAAEERQRLHNLGVGNSHGLASYMQAWRHGLMIVNLKIDLK